MLAASTVRLPRAVEVTELRGTAGRTNASGVADRHGGSPPDEGPSVTLHEALVDPRQWCLNVAWFLLGGLAMMVSVHIVPFARDRGISLADASLALSAYGVGSVTGRIAAGAGSDRIGTLTTIPIAYLLEALALLVLLWVPSRAALLGSLAVFGGGFAASGTMSTNGIPHVLRVRASG